MATTHKRKREKLCKDNKINCKEGSTDTTAKENVKINVYNFQILKLRMCDMKVHKYRVDKM